MDPYSLSADLGTDPLPVLPEDVMADFDDLALEDLGDLLVPINPDTNATSGSFIGYTEPPGVPGVPGPTGGMDFLGDLGYLAGPQARHGTVRPRPPSSLNDLPPRRPAAAKRARTRYTADIGRRPAGRGTGAGSNVAIVTPPANPDSATAVGAAPAPSPTASRKRTPVVKKEVNRKMRKNNRERQRRIEINENFDRLGVLVNESRAKSDKVTILQAAITEIQMLRAKVYELQRAAEAPAAPPSVPHEQAPLALAAQQSFRMLSGQTDDDIDMG